MTFLRFAFSYVKLRKLTCFFVPNINNYWSLISGWIFKKHEFSLLKHHIMDSNEFLQKYNFFHILTISHIFNNGRVGRAILKPNSIAPPPRPT